ncbi:hypothetical protein J5X84_07970 [Streptosporangiaceae bacterium NEAU-GS5]|nr:hypothetical protein [Streptosporangiaceae bacterium NEAU-GS5]
MTRRIALALGLAAAVILAGGTPASASQGVWRRLPVSGQPPTERSAPVAAALGSSIYLFGGVRDDFATGQNTFLNDLRRFDTRTGVWRLLSPHGGPPPARAFGVAAAQASTGRVFVFGGGTFDNFSLSPLNDLWAYSAAANTWTELHPRTSAPAARSGPVMWISGDRLYLFGGITAAFATLNDLWAYDLRANTWTELIPDGAPGSPPARHVAQAGGAEVGGVFTIYGGETIDATGNFVQLNDTWQLRVATRTWTRVTFPSGGDIAPPRNYGAAATIGQNLYLHGGDLPGGSAGCGAPFPQNPNNELWRFDVRAKKWARLQPAGDPVARLKRHVAVAADGRMYVVSGWDFQCADGVGPGQVWNLNTYAFTP